MLPRNKNLKQSARELRKNMTEVELMLWAYIRRKQIHGIQFYRQYVIGNFIVDFYCPKARLVIEADGGQHFSEGGRASDRNRDAYLGSLGLRVLRYNNREVLANIDGVISHLTDALS